MAKQLNRVSIPASFIVFICFLPMLIFWFFFGQAQGISPEDALVKLQNAPDSNLLVDVRSIEEFQTKHIAGAVNFPHDKITAWESRDDIPDRFRNKNLFFICQRGLLSAWTVSKIKPKVQGDLFNIQGGIQEWVLMPGSTDSALYLYLKSEYVSRLFPFVHSSLTAQWAVCISAFAVKPFYMILSFVLVLILSGNRHSDMTALQYGFFFFLLGEIFCAVNFLFYNEKSLWAEYLHNLGMVGSFGFITYALFDALDRRTIKFTDKNDTCALLKTCQSCYKHTEFPCRFRYLFLYMTAFFFVLCFVPLLADIRDVSYSTDILGSHYGYVHAGVHQIFEIRYAPVAAGILFIAGFFVLWINQSDAMTFAKICVSAGWGFLGFSYFRLILLNTYSDTLAWFIVWEEITEWLFVLCAAVIFWLFRKSLFQDSKNMIVKQLIR